MVLVHARRMSAHRACLLLDQALGVALQTGWMALRTSRHRLLQQLGAHDTHDRVPQIGILQPVRVDAHIAHDRRNPARVSGFFSATKKEFDQGLDQGPETLDVNGCNHKLTQTDVTNQLLAT